MKQSDRKDVRYVFQIANYKFKRFTLLRPINVLQMISRAAKKLQKLKKR